MRRSSPSIDLRARRERRKGQRFRIAGFEELESRCFLSATSLGATDHLSIAPLEAAHDQAPALIGAALAPLVSLPLAQVRLVAEDLDNHPIDTIRAGQDFELAAFVEDIREAPPPNNWQGIVMAGAWSVFTNVAYDANLVSIAAEPGISNANSAGNQADPRIEFGDYFGQGIRYGDLSSPGQIVGAGAASLQFSGSGAGPVLLWSITVHADAAGVVLFEPSFDPNVVHESNFIDPVVALTADQIQFTPLELPIIGPPPAIVTSSTLLDEGNPETTIFEGTEETEATLDALASSDRALTTDDGVQQSPSVAVDPSDAQHIVVAYMDYSRSTTGYAGIGIAASNDGGQQWQHTSLALPEGFDQGAANPIAKFDGQGHVFVTFMSATFLGDRPPITNPAGGPLRALGFHANNGVFVSRSDDGGASWQSPVAVTSHLYDGIHDVPFEIMPDLAIDTFATLPDGRPNPNHGSMYAVWSRYYPAGQYPGELDSKGGGNIMFAVSRDGGQSWQTMLESQPSESSDPVTVIFNPNMFYGTEIPPGKGFENWAHVTIGPESDIYVSQFMGGQFAVHHSVDGGRSFSHPDPSSKAGFPFGLNTDIGPGPLATEKFRLQVVRTIAADPTRPGYLYVAEANAINDPQGSALDEGDIIFARSTDYGATWQTSFRINGRLSNVINDDNDGRSATGLASDVASGQALPRLVVDAQGNIALVWYDTRRDPAGHLLDVFATISTDGGRTFNPNIRLSDHSFDADAGAFTDANGAIDYYLGDFLGLDVADGTAYAAWADTRSNNQDIYFRSYPINPLSAPANDRFEPNDTRDRVTDLGQVVARDVPKLGIAPGDEDWFRVQTGATGDLTISTQLEVPGDRLRLELFDDSGTTSLATGSAVRDAGGNVIGQSIVFPSAFDQTYLVRVVSAPGADEASSRYTLAVRSLTADLGTRVHGVRSGSLADGDRAFYTIAAAAPGSLDISLTPAASAKGNFHLELLDPKTSRVLATGHGNGSSQHVSLVVSKDQAVYIRVIGDEGTQGDFSLEFNNLNQFTTPDNKTLFFPTGAGPSASKLADLNGDGALDVVVTHVGRDIISVLLNNGDGTFRSPREFAVGAFQQGGPFTLQGLPNFHRDLAIADFNRDGVPDVAVVNTSSSDVSVLLGNGDGTFQPQRRFDATAAPFALSAGDIDNDGIVDLAVVDSTAGPAQGGILLGRGDGSFRPLRSISLTAGEPFRTNAITIADMNHDGKNDLVLRDFFDGTVILLGHGDGTFAAAGRAIQPANGPGVAVADLDADGNLDVVTTRNNTGEVIYARGHGDGAFDPITLQAVGQFPVAVAVADIASVTEDGTVVLGVADGHADLIVANNGRTTPLASGPAEIVVLAGLVNEQGQFDGFNDPVRLDSARGPLDLKVGDVNQDGTQDVIVVDRDGIEVIFGKLPTLKHNETRQTARDLGTVVHLVFPTLTITPGHEDAWYRLRVPQESFAEAKDQVLDFSAGFAHVEALGLQMEVVDSAGVVRGAGERFRVTARQGETLLVHLFGKSDSLGERGFGAYSLVVDTLPQIAAVEAHTFLPGQGGQPGGPTTSLVLVLQGDRLDSQAAENLANYHVIWAGPDNIDGTSDDREIPIGTGLSANVKTIIFDPGANVDVASGRTYPTALRQTMTLLFGEPLPAGSYRIDVAAGVISAAFNLGESSLLSDTSVLAGHPIVSSDGGDVQAGASLGASNLVQTAGRLGDFGLFERGTRFLTQFHNDLGALLDSQLTAHGDEATITGRLLDQIVAKFSPALGPIGQRLSSLLVIFLDPVSIGLVDHEGRSFNYDLQKNLAANNLSRTFVEVGGNVEVIVIPNPVGAYGLNVADVPSLARGGAIYLSNQANDVRMFTDALRSGITQFSFDFGASTLRSTLPPGSFDAAIAGVTALRSVAPQALSSLTSSDAPNTKVSNAASSSSSAPSFATVAPRGARAAGKARPTSSGPLQAIGELFSQFWNELVQGVFRVLRGSGRANSGGPSPDDSSMRKARRLIERLTVEAAKIRSDSPPALGRTSDRNETPMAPVKFAPGQAWRDTLDRESQTPMLVTSGKGVDRSAEVSLEPAARARSSDRSRETTSITGGTSEADAPAESSSSENATSGSPASAPSS